jgi:hypothetical protein
MSPSEPNQLDRIEAKLDALLMALADEEEAQETHRDMDGNEMPAQGEGGAGGLDG